MYVCIRECETRSCCVKGRSHAGCCAQALLRCADIVVGYALDLTLEGKEVLPNWVFMNIPICVPMCIPSDASIPSCASLHLSNASQ